MGSNFIASILGAELSGLSLAGSDSLLAASFSKRGDVYNILWILVFAFATINILGLVARRFEPERSRLSLGETFAVLVVVVSVLLLAWEMLYLFKVLPIQLSG
jgi:CHASE2 domain-containing sensor protein